MLQTRVVRIEKTANGALSEESLSAIREAGAVLQGGGLVAFPTETVYGLGGDAFNPESSRKIYAAKGRPSDNPLIVHIAETDMLSQVAAQIPDSAYALARAFWPGPLTMILKKAETLPKETTGGLSTVAVRLPSDPTARALIRSAGGFVAAPSANRSGRPSPTAVKYVIEDLNGRVDVILDGGSSIIGLESTIVDLTVYPPMILRPGAVTREDLCAVLGEVAIDRTLLSAQSKEAPKAPGMKYRHYAPKGELTLVRGKADAVVSYINAETERANNKITAVIATEETAARYTAALVKSVGSRGDQESIARNLYRILRELDDEGAELIFSEEFDGAGLSQATMNRLLKAAGHKEVTV